MAYATVNDLMQRWKALGEPDRAKAETLLDDAAVILDSMVEVDPEDEKQAALLKTISCSMVKRAMAAGVDAAIGVTQGTISADIYSQTFQYANPGGDLYLTSLEKKLLGVTNSYIGTLPVATNPQAVSMRGGWY